MTITREDRIRGCILGGAVGDALGAQVEFDSLERIRAQFGQCGITGYQTSTQGLISDDTQMTLFTIEGIIQSRQPVHMTIHRAHMEWLRTQLEVGASVGALADTPGLKHRRAPGDTVMASLEHAAVHGTLSRNDSKGCGALMRTAPIGLAFPLGEAYRIAVSSAETTHGHPTSSQACGFFAMLIGLLARGSGLTSAIIAADVRLQIEAQTSMEWDVIDAIQKAQKGAMNEDATPEAVQALGKGWVADEALAIALFCALKAKTFEEGVLLAVNHGGDSDSTGSLTGQILGTLRGVQGIPARWLDGLELRALIDKKARELASV